MGSCNLRAHCRFGSQAGRDLRPHSPVSPARLDGRHGPVSGRQNPAPPDVCVWGLRDSWALGAGGGTALCAPQGTGAGGALGQAGRAGPRLPETGPQDRVSGGALLLPAAVGRLVFVLILLLTKLRVMVLPVQCMYFSKSE